MKYFSTVVPGCIMSFVLLLCVKPTQAQSILNSNGNVKSTQQYYADKAAEAANAKRNAATAPKPATTTQSNRDPSKKQQLPAPIISEVEVEKSTAAELKGYEDERKTSFIESSRKYDQVYIEKHGLFRVKLDGKYGYIDTYGKVKVAVMYDDARDFESGRATVKLDGHWGMIDRDGKRVIGFAYDEPISYNDGSEIAVLCEAGKYGCMSFWGLQWMIEPVYEGMKTPSNGFVGAKLNGKWGFLDYKGNVKIDFQFDEIIKSFETCCAAEVIKDNAKFSIDLWGSVTGLKTKLVVTRDNGVTKYMDQTGTEVFRTPPVNTNEIPPEGTAAKVASLETKAPDFTQKDITGKSIALSSFKGKYVLLYFWASWSGPDKIESQNVAANFNRF